MFCERCGNQLPPGATFCANCGARPQPAAAGSTQLYAPYGAQTGYGVAQPQAYYGAAAGGSPPLSVGQYVGMFILLSIPLLNIILLLVWAFGGTDNLNKKNFARAALVFGLIAAVLWGLSLVLMGALGIAGGLLQGLL